MPHDVSLISTLAAGFGLALVLGFVAERLRLPALVGYLLAGIAIGPATPGFVADVGIAAQLSEIGVMLLMFGVGLHFSLADLLAVRRIAVPGAVVQMVVATALGAGLAAWWGWAWGAALVFGLCLSVASTVVLLKALEARGEVETLNGRIAVGWLVVEDLAMVLVLVLLPPLAGVLGGTVPAEVRDVPLWRTLATTLLQVGAFVALMLVAGRRVLPWVLYQVSRTGSRELFTLSIVAAAIGIAFGAAKLFSVSFALGAFFAGMVMRESEFSHRAAEESLPLRDAFSVLFFVSVGMLFDPAVLFERPLQVAAVVAIIVFGKSLAAMALVVAFRYPLRTATVVSASLAQIGEFSFILAGLGGALGLLPPEGTSLVVAGALITIAVNPFFMASAVPLAAGLVSRFRWAMRLDARKAPYAELPSDTTGELLAGQVVLVGYGRVGSRIATGLRDARLPFVVVDQHRDTVEKLREQGIAAVAGDAADPAVLIQAHVAGAAMLVVAISDTVGLERMVEVARTLNPTIEVVVRTHDESESSFVRRDGLGTVFFGEEVLARGMVDHVVGRFEEVRRPAEVAARTHATS
ncbi:MAG TPA: cation:proton antiporter [Burkholderiaceae bacterium]|nr:cation:proton antiporter [Burkholderiaceae bacterium]